MTNEEAIEVLKDLWRYEHTEFSEKVIREALVMAIRALKNEQTDEDLISREEVLKEGAYYSNRPTHTFLNDVIKVLPAIPQADSETEYWKERAKSYERTIVALQKGIAEQTDTAEWIKQGYGIGYRCTNCGKIVMADDSNELKFCCNCGAKMKGV